MRLPGKSFVALGARMLFDLLFFVVFCHVTLSAGFGFKVLGTDWTAEGSVLVVFGAMSEQVPLLREPFPARRAPEWLLFRVEPGVELQLRPVLEGLATFGAEEFGGFGSKCVVVLAPEVFEGRG